MLLNARDEKWQVFDKATRAVRDITWGDMVVLVPAWTDFDAFRDAFLRMRVPFRVGGGKGFDRDDNELLLVDADGTQWLARAPKLELARGLVGEIARRMRTSP